MCPSSLPVCLLWLADVVGRDHIIVAFPYGLQAQIPYRLL
jgi:hypothetical protein